MFGLLSSVRPLSIPEIVQHISLESPRGARSVLNRLHRQAQTLESMPQRGRVVPELRELGATQWREIIVRPYRIVYRILQRTVFVLAVYDGRRDLDDVLFERLMRS